MEQMKMGKYKNYILISLVFLSQVHTLFRGCGSFVWLLNGVTKTYSLTTFLFVKHITVFILYYIALNPKGVNRKLLVFLFILSTWDVIHFIVFSGFDYGDLKLILTLITYLIYNKIKR